MKLIFFAISTLFLIVNKSSLVHGELKNIAKDFSDLMVEVQFVLQHPTFRMLNQKAQYKLLKAMFALVENFTKKSNTFIDSQLFGVGDIPTCRFC